MTSSRRAVLAALGSLSAIPALAQFRVEVSGIGLTQLPIAIAPFRGEGQALSLIHISEPTRPY